MTHDLAPETPETEGLEVYHEAIAFHPLRQCDPDVGRGPLRRRLVRLYLKEWAVQGVTVTLGADGVVRLSPRERVTDQIREKVSRGDEWREALLAVLRETR